MPTMSPNFPSASPKITGPGSISSCSCSCSCSCSSPDDAHSFLYNKLVTLEIGARKKRQLKVKSECQTIQYNLPILSSGLSPPTPAIHAILFPSKSPVAYSCLPSFLLPPGLASLTVLPRSSFDCQCRLFSDIQSWISGVMSEMQIFSPLAISNLSPRMASVFLNDTKEAACHWGHECHDQIEAFDHCMTVEIDDISEAVKIQSCSDRRCSICLEECSVAMKMPCSHEFHCGCILKWLKSGKTTCPICRFQFWT